MVQPNVIKGGGKLMKKKIWICLSLCIAISCFLGFAFPNLHPHFWWQEIPIFDAFFGFFGCIAIILFSKWIGHIWLMKSERYYD